jgi:phenylpropionate dioxygenase-like ring-hydroxylating dioxygenase large terminal subunit
LGAKFGNNSGGTKMLSHEDNIRLTRVSSGTPMGELMRRYWQPTLLSRELPEHDGAPVRVRLLGEDLIAFRDTNGKVGVVDAYCPHRRAPMFYARNEECGLRCVYHGWKFDVNGQCVDLPTEPASSKMKDHIQIKSYPTFEKAGVIFAYLGPKDQMPEPPDYEWMRAPQTHRHVSKTYEHCNWLQALEGGLDTAHSSYLHNNKLGDTLEFRQRDRAPRLDVERTDYGYYYVSHRDAKEDGTYVRVYQYVMPWQQMRAGVQQNPARGNRIPKHDGHIWVPIDDEQTFVYNWKAGVDENARLDSEYVEKMESYAGRGQDDLIPGSFKLKRNPENDYLIDRHMQKVSNFTGIVGVNTQDFALQESMGGVDGKMICDRTQENLGSTDKAIIAMRNLLLEATRDVEAGKRPRGSDPKTHSQCRPHDGLVPRDADWRQTFADNLVCKW